MLWNTILAGFLISAYLIEVFDWSVDMAVNSYIAARPPGIYKEESFNIKLDYYYNRNQRIYNFSFLKMIWYDIIEIR